VKLQKIRSIDEQGLMRFVADKKPSSRMEALRPAELSLRERGPSWTLFCASLANGWSSA
jgi:hypothetical protein